MKNGYDIKKKSQYKFGQSQLKKINLNNFTILNIMKNSINTSLSVKFKYLLMALK